jgi:OST3 / OST6 family, transporter family
MFLLNLTVVSSFTDVASIQQYKDILKNSDKHLIVLFTTQFDQCPTCNDMYSNFNKLEQSINEFLLKNPNSSMKPELYHVNLKEKPAIAQLHGIQRVPAVANFPPKKPRKSIKDDYPMKNTSILDFVSWAGKRLNMDLKVVYSFNEKLWFTTKVVIGILSLIITGLFLLLKARKSTMVIAVAGILINFIASSGLFYNLLQGMNWYGHDGSYIMKSVRGQYLGEGIAMSLCTSIAGISLFLSTRLLRCQYKYISDRFSIILSCVLAIFAYTLIQTVLNIYRTKTGWYQEPPFFPPPNAKKGPLWVDRGNFF